jgi:hypothetical protein
MSSDARFIIPETNFSNPNDLATHLVIGVTFFIVPLIHGSVFQRLFALALIVPSIVFILRTGSRGNFVAVVALMIAAFFLGGRTLKLIMITGTPIVIGASLLLIPTPTLKRLTLFMSSDSEVAASLESGAVDAEGLGSSISSQQARIELIRRSVRLTLQNPIFGVGPFHFEYGMDELVRSETGRKSNWQGSHNTYLPGAAMYIAILIINLRTSFRTYRQALKIGENQIAGQALGLLLSLFAWSVSTFFSHLLWSEIVPILVGLVGANYLACVEATARRQAANSPTPAPPLVPATHTRGRIPLKGLTSGSSG